MLNYKSTYMEKIIFTLLAGMVIMLTGCSDNDEPNTDYKFDTLEKVCGDKTWTSDKTTFFASNGQEIDQEFLVWNYMGADLGLHFSVNNGKFIQYCRPDGNTLERFMSDFTFDRESGNIYLNGSSKPFAQIISVTPDRIILHTHFGKWVTKDMIEGNDKSDDSPDEGSYAEMIMVPADESMF